MDQRTVQIVLSRNDCRNSPHIYHFVIDCSRHQLSTYLLTYFKTAMMTDDVVNVILLLLMLKYAHAFKIVYAVFGISRITNLYIWMWYIIF